ncbi:MAG: TonB-dependent receptor [Acidobacteriota bacterium]
MTARSLAIVLLLLSVHAVAARSADTGTVSGAVFDPQGTSVADAVVIIRGEQLPAGRQMVTGANGTYQFEYLIPGEYTLDIEKTGVGRISRSASVGVGRGTQVDAVLGLTVQEALTVTGTRPLVDVRSPEVAFNFQRDALDNLPVERTYRGLFQLMPGVADNRSAVGPTGGGSRQDNTYLIDGANITNVAFGTLSTDVNQLDIVEVNLKRAAVNAEFGRASGMVVNAVSRSGSNRLLGLGRIDWLPTGLVGAYQLPSPLLAAGVRPGTFRDPLLATALAPAIGVGGPILTDRLFFYGSARYSRETKWDRVNKVATSLPDEVRTSPEGYGKLTAVPTGAEQLTLSYRDRPNHVDNAGLTVDVAPSVATTTDNANRIATLEWARFSPTGRALNVRYLYTLEENEDVPATNLGYLPAFDPRNLARMGQYADPAQSNLSVGANQYTSVQNYRRHELRGTFSRPFDVRRTTHALKMGAAYEFGAETLRRAANGWGAIAAITQSGVPALRTRYYTPQPPQVGEGRTTSLFAQDDITIGNRLTVNAGVLLNRDAFAQQVAGSGGCPATASLRGGAAVYESDGDTCTFLRFGFADEIQPRLGSSYQLRQGRGDKLYGNWGRYYAMDQKSTARSLAPSRIFQTQTVFDLNGAVLSSAPLASTTGKLIDPALRPTYTDEIVLGYATPFARHYSLDVFVLSRTMRNFIEDVPSRLNGTAPDSGPFVAANLPCTAFAACRTADAERTYRAFTVDVRRRLAGRWLGDLSYTWSRFAGNFDLDYSTLPVFNTSSFIQDGPGTNVEDPNRFGPLFEDRPHVVKLFSSYAVTSRLTAAGYVRVQSGTPWAARARDWEGAVLNYLEPAGSHRNPTWANLDLMASYRLPVGRGNFSVEARVLNVFNNQTQLSTDAQQYLDLRTLPTAPYFAPYVQPNPFFGAGNAFAPPRRLYLAAAANF